jgi:uncharacterized protein YcfJ
MLSVTALCVTGMALAQQPSPAAAPAATQSLSKSLGVVVFPAKGQTAEQQAQDEGECYAWSRTDSGIDPMAPATVQPAPAPTQPAAQEPGKQAPQGGALRGAARGAAAGAVIGEVADGTTAENAAAVGATAGAMRGARKQREAATQQAAASQQQAAQQQAAAQQQTATAQQQQLQTFNKGFSACMQSKGYTVN